MQKILLGEFEYLVQLRGLGNFWVLGSILEEINVILFPSASPVQTLRDRRFWLAKVMAKLQSKKQIRQSHNFEFVKGE